MAFIITWDEAVPTNSNAANTIDDEFRDLKLSVSERMISGGFSDWKTASDRIRAEKLFAHDVNGWKLRKGDDSADLVSVDIAGNMTVLGTVTSAGGSAACYITRAAGQAMNTAISFTAEVIDPAGLFTIGSPTRITIATTGTYFFLLTAIITNSIGVNSGSLTLRKNGVTAIFSQNHDADVSPRNNITFSGLASLVATDYVEVIPSHSNGTITDTHVVVIKLP